MRSTILVALVFWSGAGHEVHDDLRIAAIRTKWFQFSFEPIETPLVKMDQKADAKDQKTFDPKATARVEQTEIDCGNPEAPLRCRWGSCPTVEFTTVQDSS